MVPAVAPPQEGAVSFSGFNSLLERHFNVCVDLCRELGL